MAKIKEAPCKYGGWVWIEDEFGNSRWSLIVDGVIKAQSTDHDYILKEFYNYSK